MLDIKLPELKGRLEKSKDLLNAILNEPIVAEEKFDGTKLTLIRNNEPYAPHEPHRNWLVSYKGNAIYEEEFFGVPPGDFKYIRRGSIGYSQYMLIWDRLHELHDRAEDVPLGTELFLEFVQQKPTISRDYERVDEHPWYLLQAAPCNYFVRELRAVSCSGVPDEDLRQKLSASLMIPLPPVLFEGILGSRAALKGLLDLPSTLGGKTEGVVIRSRLGTFKHLQADQHDRFLRHTKKTRFEDRDPAAEKLYWEKIQLDAHHLVLDAMKYARDLSSTLVFLSNRCYGDASRRCHSHFRRNLTMQNDDLMLTSRIILQRLLDIGDAQSVGVFPLAGKPVHAGHWRVIKRACHENDRVYVMISVKDRENVAGSKMFDIWKRLLLKHLPSNAVPVFTENPFLEASRAIEGLTRHPVRVSVYADPYDANKSWNEETLVNKFPALHEEKRLWIVPVSRTTTVNVSGTEMREFLTSGNREQFIAGLPPCLTPVEADEIWTTLSNT